MIFFHFAVSQRQVHVHCLHIHISTEYVLHVYDIESSSSITWLAIFLYLQGWTLRIVRLPGTTESSCRTTELPTDLKI